MKEFEVTFLVGSGRTGMKGLACRNVLVRPCAIFCKRLLWIGKFKIRLPEFQFLFSSDLEVVVFVDGTVISYGPSGLLMKFR